MILYIILSPVRKSGKRNILMTTAITLLYPVADLTSTTHPKRQVAFFHYSDMLNIFGYSEAIEIAGQTYHPGSSRLISR